MSPDDIAEKLGIEATGGYKLDPMSKARPRREYNYWCWSTDFRQDPTDNLSHIQRIIDKFSNKIAELDDLRNSGCKIDVCCYMVTTGQGGPELDLNTMQSLCDLGLNIWWDVYKGDENTT
jgi:hypothetical protein